MPRFHPDDLETVIDSSHAFVGSIAYHLNRSQGLLDRLKLAAKADCVIEPESLSALRLAHDADELRKLADELERYRALLIATKKPINPDVPF